jgi:Uma2 family endonuclease
MTQIQAKQFVAKRTRKAAPPELHSGDRMTREEFHRIYEKMPEDFKAELIGGTVYVASPLKDKHGSAHVDWAALLGIYKAATPGVGAGDSSTVILGGDSEPQPDLFLRILQEFGGHSRVGKKGYIEGPPELIVEVAYSSRAIDLYEKRGDYARYGVWEYLVASLHDDEIFWFDLRKNSQLTAGKDGIIRVHSFPGLWIDAKAMQSGNLNVAMQTLNEGIKSPEHADFVKRLAAKRK